VHGVDAPRLSEAFNPPNALFETDGRPRQLEINHPSASLMEVESFACGVGREEQARAAADELLHHILPFSSRHASMEQHWPEVAEAIGQVMQRVAVLRKHDGGLARSPQKTKQSVNFRFVGVCVLSESQNVFEP
jgi:hypothetical protein